MRIELIAVNDIGPAERREWRRLQGEDRTIAAPSLSPGWARCVGAARADARVAALRDGAGRIEGFLPIQAGRGGDVEPLAVSLDLGCGLIGDPQLKWDAPRWLRDLGARGFPFQGAPERQAEFARAARGGVLRMAADLHGGAADYLRRKREDGLDILERRGARAAALAAKGAAPRVKPFSQDAAEFSQTLYWSAGAFRAPQQDWEIAALRAAFEREPFDEFRGVLFTLHLDGVLAAGAFFLVDHRSAQLVFYGEDPEREADEPAAIVIADAVAAFATRGVLEVDFGAVQAPMLREFASARRQRLYGLIRPAAKPRFMSRLPGRIRRAEREWSRIGPIAV